MKITIRITKTNVFALLFMKKVILKRRSQKMFKEMSLMEVKKRTILIIFFTKGYE